MLETFGEFIRFRTKIFSWRLTAVSHDLLLLPCHWNITCCWSWHWSLAPLLYNYVHLSLFSAFLKIGNQKGEVSVLSDIVRPPFLVVYLLVLMRNVLTWGFDKQVTRLVSCKHGQNISIFLFWLYWWWCVPILSLLWCCHVFRLQV